MTTNRLRTVAWVLGLAASGGCLVDAVEEAPGGVFACDVDEQCPEDQTCLVGRCESVAPPRLEVRFPEAFDVVATVTPGAAAAMMLLTVSIGGSDMALVEPRTSDDAVAGEGYVELWVDGVAVKEISSGDLAAGVSEEVVVGTTPGAHRIAAVARRADGARYDNEGALATRIVWIDDGSAQVAVVRPWPDQRIPLEATEVEVEVAALNFALVPAAASFDGPHGHAHIHYDDPFPACPADPSCDCCYIAIASPSSSDIGPEGFVRSFTQTMIVPAAAAGDGMVTAVLRQSHHTPYVTEDGAYVHDSITVQRAEEAELAVESEGS